MKAIILLTLGLTLTIGFTQKTSAQTTTPSQFPSGHLVFKNNTLHIHAHFPVMPVAGAKTSLVLEAKNAQTHQPTEINDQIEVKLWMPSMGHGSSPTVVQRATDSSGKIIPGTFNVNNVFFVMSGNWEIWITLKDAAGKSEKQSFNVNIK